MHPDTTEIDARIAEAKQWGDLPALKLARYQKLHIATTHKQRMRRESLKARRAAKSNKEAS